MFIATITRAKALYGLDCEIFLTSVSRGFPAERMR
jgi:hypothetical protein